MLVSPPALWTGKFDSLDNQEKYERLELGFKNFWQFFPHF